MEEQNSIQIVVLAHPGSEPLVRDLWGKFCDAPVTVCTWDESAVTLKDLLVDIMADKLGEHIDLRFVVIPANLVPVTPVHLDELRTPFVDVDGQRVSYWGRVPVSFDKMVLVDWLDAHDQLPDEEFVKQYVREINGRPLEVSHGYGNFYTKVLRGNPCENVVIEAMVRKRFLYVGPAGWRAIEHLLRKMLET
jgi:hypothetical protein